VEQVDDGYILFSCDGDAALQDLVRLAEKKGFGLKDIRIEVSDLDDIFLTLTGK
jgi:hypothetical protein